MLAHWFPGLGDPLDWPIDLFRERGEHIRFIEHLRTCLSKLDPSSFAIEEERRKWLRRAGRRKTLYMNPAT